MNVDVTNLKEAIAALMRDAGATDAESQAVAHILAEADMKGVVTHGVYFLPMLLERIRMGLVEVPTAISVEKDEGAVLHLDGGNGIGQFTAEKAMLGAIEKAGAYGIGAALVRNTNHIGLLAHFSLMAAEDGMIGIILCNSASAMAPWGGTDAFFGTNPFSIAAPGGREYPIVLDMATSQVARGKIRKAARLGEMIPETWALDSDGVPTVDPGRALEGTLMPIGGPKGYGMALFIDLICGLLSGSRYSREVKTFHKPVGPTGVGVTAIAIDIERFMPMAQFVPKVEEYIRSIRNARRAPGVDRIYLPGEIEALQQDKAMQEGVEIDDSVVSSIDSLLRDAGIDIRLGDAVGST